MRIARKIFLVITGFLLINVLLIAAIFITINNTVANRQEVKQWFVDSNTYDKVIDHAIEELIDNKAPESDGLMENGFDVDSEIIRRAASKAFSGEVLQNAVEKIMDGAYNWLEGDAPVLEFVVDFTSEKLALAENIVEEASIRLETLPSCSQTQLFEFRNDFNPFSIPCNPEVGIDEKLEEIREEFINNEDFIPNPIISAESLTVEGENGETKSLREALQDTDVQEWYQRAKTMLWVSIVASIVLTIGVILLSENTRKGLGKVATIYLIASLTVAVTGIVSRGVTDFLNFEQDSIENIVVLPVANEASESISNQQYYIAATLATIGFAIIIYLALTRNKNKDLSDKSDRESNDPPSSDQDSLTESEPLQKQARSD